jgi:uncharacterized protein YbbC (DUF1343 family)
MLCASILKMMALSFRTSLQRAALALGLFVALAWNVNAAVSLGIDELEKSNFAVLQGKRVGLVTNPSGADSRGRSAVDVLYHGKGFHLVKLFGPEHGLYGVIGAGREYGDTHDRRTGLPVYALYNTPNGADHRHPTRAMFAGLDAIVYDVQDLGNRSYTFISTLGNVMDEAAKDGVEVIVLDRPNPLGGVRIEGPRLDSSVTSFVGMYDIPYVYGLTPGELALWINARYLERPCHLTVVSMRGWTRPMVWEDTGLKWIATSPNIPTAAAMRAYTATGCLGEIGIESGCGGPHPFEVVLGSGWDAGAVTARFNALRIPGVRAKPWSAGRETGMFLNIDPHNAGNLTAINFQVLDILNREIDHFSAFGRIRGDQQDMFDKVCGTRAIRHRLEAGASANSIVNSWNSGVVRWAQERQPYLLYGNKGPKAEKKSSVVADTAGPMPNM